MKLNLRNITRRTLVFGLSAFAALSVAACGYQETPEQAVDEEAADTVITVGATPTPHAEILNGPVKELLEAQGYTLEVKEFTDYVLPNTALEEGELDANYFQHVPYLESFNEENGTHLTDVTAVHYEPFALFSNKIDNITELSDGATVAVPNDTTNEARALLLLEQEGLIKLKDDAGVTATPQDVVENPKNLQFQEIEAANLPNVLPDVDLAAINGNYAIPAGLSLSDALATESADSLGATTYANVLVVREGEQNEPKIIALADALTSPETYKFIEETYDGAVVPTFQIDEADNVAGAEPQDATASTEAAEQDAAAAEGETVDVDDASTTTTTN